VAKYYNKKETEKIGSQIQELRKKNELTIEDVSTMSGFARSTITAIEAGANTDTSHLIEIAKAIGVHPMELFNVPFVIKPRNKRSPDSIKKSLLTSRINKLVSDSNEFNTPKQVKDIIHTLFIKYEIKAESSHVSVVLKRLVKDGKLNFTKAGRKNSYLKASK